MEYKAKISGTDQIVIPKEIKESTGTRRALKSPLNH